MRVIVKSYMLIQKDAEEIIKKHNLDDAKIILCTSDGRGDVTHLLIVMFKFIIGLVSGLFLGEYYDYTFSGLIDWVDNILQNSTPQK